MQNQYQIHPVLAFLAKHKTQIRVKAIKFGLDPEDFEQDVALFILEHGAKHDPTRSNFAAFVFGCLEKISRRQTVNVSRHAKSIDDTSEAGLFFRASVETVSIHESEEETSACYRLSQLPGAANLASLANEISGKSAKQLGEEKGLTKRRINQILAAARTQAKVQHTLFGSAQNE